MNEFTNQTIDISTLPKFEETTLNPLQKDYFKVMLIQFGIVFGILLIGIIALYLISIEELIQNKIIYFIIGWLVLLLLSFLYLKISFAKKGFALREHDVIFRSGVISETTTIVTNNRVQHVALHQGMLSRYFGLASIELFTAGGSASDLKINGLLLEDAKKVKESVSLKINEIEAEVVEEQINEDQIQVSENNLKEDSDEI
ncbi:PH domain-containing protein [uncultured Flavobacterium sp.]|uniref:PH domain-containing protein n=1 Tax=uncultured Flavobacterium sp. TaxID=165435 RepID=UPI0030EDF966|tara:strand:- start:252841 stop:253443 length:603 start_codon:yes stop_codon:yes gene_type:complete